MRSKDVSKILYNIAFVSQIQGVFEKVDYLRVYFYEFLKQQNGERIYQTNWKGLKVNYWNTLWILRNDIIQNKNYEVDLKKDKPIILDVGFNLGFFTLYMKHKFPNAIIYAFEPTPETYKFGKENVEQNNLKDVHIFNKGILSKDKKMKFWVRGSGAGDSIFKKEGHHEITCTFVNFNKVLAKTGAPDILKLDIEGAEYELLEHSNKLFDAKHLLIEFHEDFKPSKKDYIDLVLKHDYDLIRKTESDNNCFTAYFKKRVH